MPRKICITSADGQTGHLIAELLLTDDSFSPKISKLFCLTLHPEKCSDLAELGAEIIPHKPGNVRSLVHTLKAAGVDAIIMIPPAHENKLKISEEMIMAVRQTDIMNTILVSSAASELADEKDHPRLREFIKIESIFLESKGLTSGEETQAAYSPCTIR